MRTIGSIAGVAFAALLLSACGSTELQGGPGDGTSDTATDTGDSTVDIVPDPTVDPGTDVAPDPTVDPGTDVIPDPTVDPGVDVIADTTVDPGYDTAYDPGTDLASDPGPPGIVGAACSDAGDCTGVPSSNAECVTDIYGMLTLPGGYCSASCTASTECGPLGECVDLFGFMSYCVRTCSTSFECRRSEGYECGTIPGGPPDTYCLPPMGGPDSGPVDP